MREGARTGLAGCTTGALFGLSLFLAPVFATALAGPILGTALVVYLTNWLGTQGVGQVTLVLGAVLTLFVLLFRNGLVPSLSEALSALQARLREARSG